MTTIKTLALAASPNLHDTSLRKIRGWKVRGKFLSKCLLLIKWLRSLEGFLLGIFVVWGLLLDHWVCFSKTFPRPVPDLKKQGVKRRGGGGAKNVKKGRHTSRFWPALRFLMMFSSSWRCSDRLNERARKGVIVFSGQSEGTSEIT